MIVGLQSKYSLEQLLHWSRTIVLSGVVLVVVIFGFKDPGSVASHKAVSEKGLQLNFEKMLTGPLALRENSKSPLVLSLENRLVLLAQSARPDLPRKDRCFCIGIKGAESQKVVREGEAIFVDLSRHSSGGVEEIAFVEGGSQLMIPHLLDDYSLLLKLEGFDETAEVLLQAGVDFSIGSGVDPALGALKTASWLGEDAFFQKYGSAEYAALGKKEKVQVVSEDARYILYVREKEYLTFKEGRWVPIGSLAEADKEAPLAQVQRVGPTELEVEAWDEEGFVLFYCKIPKLRAAPFQRNLEQVILEPQLRNESQVSCKIGKKHFQIVAGDWLLQRNNNWQKLKKIEEIEAFLNHELTGELLVVDEISSQGVVMGSFFDETRTQTQPAQIRAMSSRSQRKLRSK